MVVYPIERKINYFEMKNDKNVRCIFLKLVKNDPLKPLSYFELGIYYDLSVI